MRKHPGRALLLVGAAAAALTLTLSAPPSSATTASTWTVKPGGKFTATNISKITIKDTETRIPIICKSSSLVGKLESGSGLLGAKIASITKFSFSGCFSGGEFTFTVKTGIFPYHMNAKSYNAASGETLATITGIVGFVTGSGCTMTFAGPTAATPGRIEVKYANSTHKLQIVTGGGTLHFYNVSGGCLGLWSTGDHMAISGTYAVTPAQTITSP